MILASEDFRDEEYNIPRAYWEKNNADVMTASTVPVSKGMLGTTVENDLLLDEVKEGDFDGIFWVGGGGAAQYGDNQTAKNLTKKFISAGKPVGAICISPRNFLKWGILTGKKCTCWNGDQAFGPLAQKAGAIYEPKPVVVDGKILTAEGPESAEEVAVEFLELFE